MPNRFCKEHTIFKFLAALKCYFKLKLVQKLGRIIKNLHVHKIDDRHDAKFEGLTPERFGYLCREV